MKKKPKLHPDDKVFVEEAAKLMGVTPRWQRTMFERMGFRVCDSCGHFHRPSDGCVIRGASAPF